MSIREIASIEEPYSAINREERHYVAVLFAALTGPQKKESISKFLKLCKHPPLSDLELESCEVYFEYAFLRDIWSTLSDDKKKDIVCQCLPKTVTDKLQYESLKEFNKTFVGSNASARTVQSPGRWSNAKIAKICEKLDSSDERLQACRFKWAFNIKPDLVIHINKDSAVCVEAKCTASESKYSACFETQKGKHTISETQLKLQHYMMKELLGIETRHILLEMPRRESVSKSKRPNEIPDGNSIVLSWKTVLEELGMGDVWKRMEKALRATDDSQTTVPADIA